MNKASWRARKAVPSAKGKFVEVFSSIFKQSAPNTKKSIAQNISLDHPSKRRLDFLQSAFKSVKSTMQNLQKRRNKKDLTTKKTLA